MPATKSNPTWKLKAGTTWRDKLERPNPKHGSIVQFPAAMRKRLGAGTLLIPKPLDIDALIRKVRPGRITTTPRLRATLASAAGADQTCGLCTGIFLRIVAEAAEEDRAAGKSRITPYWRVVKEDGSLNEKFPGGAKAQAKLLREEGHTIQPAKGKKAPRVALPDLPVA